MLTLVAELGDQQPSAPLLPPGFVLRSTRRDDRDALGALYFAAYPTGIACDSIEEAFADIDASFAGDYGEFWWEASPVIEHQGRIIAAVMTVRRAPWPDTPDCPFIIELFTDPGYRRLGLARTVARRCLAIAQHAGATQIALRVADDNIAARTLYTSLGFDPWKP